MPLDLEAQLPILIPRATEWAIRLAAEASATGTYLDPQLVDIARRVGVRHPERIRLRVVDKVPLPTDPMLAQAARQAGLAGEGMVGITLGNVVFVRSGHETDVRLLSHEFRHVAQYESSGGIAGFLEVHLRHLAAFGYEDAPFEIDARAHEIGPG